MEPLPRAAYAVVKLLPRSWLRARYDRMRYSYQYFERMTAIARGQTAVPCSVR
ncbi:MAG: hypothetical protein ACLR93_10080 [Alistipes onderdonkii]